MRFLQLGFITFLILTNSFTVAQDIDIFRTIFTPSIPFGGIEELKSFVKQEVVYPDELLERNVKGSVFITYLIDENGHVAYKKVVDYGDTLFRLEAERIFDKILWEKDTSRASKQLGYEKIKFNFNPKKYLKVVKKRGYHKLPYKIAEIDFSSNCYSINQIDTAPTISNSYSINHFIKNNFKYPSIALKMGKSGRVSVEFVIEPYGKASNVRIVEPVAGGCNEETVRLVKLIDWNPGIKNNKAVRTLYQYQLNFVHPGGTIR